MSSTKLSKVSKFLLKKKKNIFIHITNRVSPSLFFPIFSPLFTYLKKFTQLSNTLLLWRYFNFPTASFQHALVRLPSIGKFCSWSMNSPRQWEEIEKLFWSDVDFYISIQYISVVSTRSALLINYILKAELDSQFSQTPEYKYHIAVIEFRRCGKDSEALLLLHVSWKKKNIFLFSNILKNNWTRLISAKSGRTQNLNWNTCINLNSPRGRYRFL